jgi:hypothetical protein
MGVPAFAFAFGVGRKADCAAGLLGLWRVYPRLIESKKSDVGGRKRGPSLLGI